MLVNFNGKHYWYDSNDMVYKTDAFGYVSTIDISSIPYPVLERFLDQLEDKLKKAAK